MATTNNTYETLYDELQTIIDSLQSGELDLDDAVKKYERSIVILDSLEKLLSDAQNKVTKIKANLK